MGSLPEVTHLQYAALWLLRIDVLRAEDLRRGLKKLGAGHRSGPSFYQFMGRLEEQSFVSAKRKRKSNGHLETSYRLLKKGRKTINRSKTFYGARNDTDT